MNMPAPCVTRNLVRDPSLSSVVDSVPVTFMGNGRTEWRALGLGPWEVRTFGESSCTLWSESADDVADSLPAGAAASSKVVAASFIGVAEIAQALTPTGSSREHCRIVGVIRVRSGIASFAVGSSPLATRCDSKLEPADGWQQVSCRNGIAPANYLLIGSAPEADGETTLELAWVGVHEVCTEEWQAIPSRYRGDSPMVLR